LFEITFYNAASALNVNKFVQIAKFINFFYCLFSLTTDWISYSQIDQFHRFKTLQVMS